MFRFTPEDYRPYSLFFPYLRRKLVELFVVDCGRKVRVKHNADVSPDISIGDFSELGQHSLIHNGVKIGSYVIMGPNVKIYCRNHRFDRLDIPIALQGKCFEKTFVGNDVWIGANVIILPGVEVGDHSIVAAGSVVTHSFEPFSVIGGNPARLIRYRDSSSH